jgi:hypothetical protein
LESIRVPLETLTRSLWNPEDSLPELHVHELPQHPDNLAIFARAVSALSDVIGKHRRTAFQESRGDDFRNPFSSIWMV